MTANEIKNEGLKYAKELYNTGNLNIDTEANCTAAEWFAIMDLANIYFNVLDGKITREEAQGQQKKVFDLIAEHSRIFEFEEG